MNSKDQVEALMNELLSFAEKMLKEHGEFHPFGGYLKASGAIVHVGAQSNTDSGKSQQKIDALTESFKQIATQGKATAFGIVADVKLPRGDGSKGYAIKCFLEHRDGYCAEVFFRYEATAEEGVEITDTIAQQGDPIFFTRSIN